MEVGVHNHPADKAKHIADEVINKIKESAVSTKENPRAIVIEASTSLSLPISTKLPSIQLIKKTISRKRKA